MISNRLAALTLKASRWTFVGDVPTVPKFVCLAVPHTSNWDGALLIAISQAIEMPISWMIKDDWVKGPMGMLLRRLGAVAINRKGSHNVVDQMIAEFERRDRLALVIPPEGTRSHAEHWRSGFYHIALGAKVPVVPGYLDYSRRRCGLGAPIEMTGDVGRDMDRIRAYYREVDAKGSVPESVGPIRLREEDRAEETSS